MFWELYLPVAFSRFGIEVARGNGALLEPDFHFQSDDTRIFIEAVACSEPTKESNRVHPPIENSNFEDGIAPEARII
jgi:hypothetical protein